MNKSEAASLFHTHAVERLRTITRRQLELMADYRDLSREVSYLLTLLDAVPHLAHPDSPETPT